MKFGLFGGALASNSNSPDSQNYMDFCDYVCEADRLGFHSSFVVEHHFTGVGQVSSTLSLLTYLAARTERIRLGTGVIVMPWHNPVLLAEQVATLDLLSGGRVDIGVGKGYRPYEFEGFCIERSEAAERYEEGLDVMLRSLTEAERFSHSGKYWKFENIIVEPRPVQQPHPPIWIGATSDGSIRGTAERGFNLLLDHWAPSAIILERMSVFQEALKKSGSSYSSMNVGVARAVKVCPDADAKRDAIETRAKQLMGSGVLAAGSLGDVPEGSTVEEHALEIAKHGMLLGTPDEIIEQLQTLEKSGITYILLSDTARTIDSLREFEQEVMSPFLQSSEAATGKVAAA